MAKGGRAKKQKQKKKKTPTKRPGKNKKNSPLKKTNKRSSKQQMRRNKKKMASSKQQMQQNKQQYAAQMKKESTDFNKQSLDIKADKSLSKEERRKKLTALQLQRRVREKEATQRLAGQREAHSARKERYRSAQERQQSQYRQRKRAVDFSDRQMQRRSVTRTQTVAATSGAVAQAQILGGAPMYPVGGGGGGFYPGMPGAPPPPFMPPQMQQPEFDGENEPGNVPAEVDRMEGEEIQEGEDEDMSVMRATGKRSVVPTRSVVVGIDEPEEDVEIPDIPALSEVDPRMMREFMLARLRFERATTIDEKIKYSTQFFEIAAKMDRMFHVHAALWHRVVKFRPSSWTVAYAGSYTDSLPKETVEELSRLSSADLRNYLESL